MNALVFSDSHGYLENMKEAIDYFRDIKTVFHLGDLIDDAKNISNVYPDLEIYAISGNNDYFTNEPNEATINLEHHTIFMTHGNKYGVYDGVERLYYKGMEENADIILFGHTHKRFLEKQQDYLILNPGSISSPRDGNIPTFAIIEDAKEDIKITFFGIYRDGIKEIK